ncbi:hypothetical protein [Latilactobacillus curvatus]|uniref:hypothetical protein n=1 Tax=Latilactobacillus curvatus TaxID=28038 RepID=UPI0020A39F84|nr:hypothetical protein [Latilactobacillus curvatus]
MNRQISNCDFDRQVHRRIVWQNIIFALVVKGIFLLLGAFGIATMWEAVFAMSG